MKKYTQITLIIAVFFFIFIYIRPVIAYLSKDHGFK